MIVELTLLGIISSCALTPTCPVTVEQASSGEFELIGDDTFVGTGYVVRFVPAPDADFRGYDLNVTRWIHGRPNEAGIFLLSDEITGIGRGQPVLIIVRRPQSQNRRLQQQHSTISGRALPAEGYS